MSVAVTNRQAQPVGGRSRKALLLLGAVLCVIPAVGGAIWLVLGRADAGFSPVDATAPLRTATAPVLQAQADEAPQGALGDGSRTSSASSARVPSGRGSSDLDKTFSAVSGVPATAEAALGDVHDLAARTEQWRRPDVARWRYDERARPDLRGRDFREAEFDYVDLAGADLRDAQLQGAGLRGADLRWVDLRGAVFAGVDLYGADLRYAVLRGTDLSPANLSTTDLRRADLRDAVVSCSGCSVLSSLMAANLNGADLRGADFGEAATLGSLFEGADLRGANLADVTGTPESLRGALYDDATRLPNWIEPDEWGMVLVASDEPPP